MTVDLSHGDFAGVWHRAYIIIHWVEMDKYVLLVLQAETKTFAFVHANEREGAQAHADSIIYSVFRRSNTPFLAAGWKAGPIGLFKYKDMLSLSKTINTVQNKNVGLFLVYCIYFLVLDIPVYFDATNTRLRENLAYHFIVGHLPF